MDVHIQLLRKSDGLREALQYDGWQLDWERNDSVWASHPQVPDQTAARSRLNHLGLLTSQFVRIEFPICARARD